LTCIESSYTIIRQKFEGTCNTTDCGSVTIQVLALSIPPGGINANPPSVCPGGASTELSVSGGSLGTNAQWVWYEGSCGGSSIGTGSTITVTLSSQTTYYVRAEGTCNTESSLRCARCTISIARVTLTVSSNYNNIPSGTPCYYVSGGNVSPESITIECGSTVTVTADSSLSANCMGNPSTISFQRWEVPSGSGVIIGNANSYTTTVTLTNGDAHIRAIYW
jgi:hypothetical protein